VEEWDEAEGRYSLTFKQSCQATPGQEIKEPFVIPVEVGLIGDAGGLPLKLEGVESDLEVEDNTRMVLEVTEREQCFTFTGLAEHPVPSLLRGFSAPVKLRFPYSRDDLSVLMSRDDDGFCRWDACQQLAVAAILESQSAPNAAATTLIESFSRVLSDASLDPAFVAEMLRLPSVNYLVELQEQADVGAIYRARERVRLELGRALQPVLLERYHQTAVEAEYQATAEQIAARSLRNTCLAYLASDSRAGVDLALNQYQNANNMTDQYAALSAIVFNGDEELSGKVLTAFYEQWQHEALVVNQWFQVQAVNPRPGAIGRVQDLMEHKDFTMANPNRMRSVVAAFCSANPLHFHAEDGSGYSLLGAIVGELDGKNPQIAARMLTPLTRWRRFSQGQEKMRGVLQSLSERELSPDVYEVVNKSLA
jgi:aminopeptidase N